MESLLVNSIGVAAVSYAFYLVWRNINGKNGCSCGSGGSCPNGESCCSAKQHPVSESSQKHS